MTRIVTEQPAVAKPIRVVLQSVPEAWTDLVSAIDYSVPDPQQKWPAEFRDPTDPGRRIQPGQILFIAPLWVVNTDPNLDVTCEFQVILEDGVTILSLGKIVIPRGETYIHPMSGQRLFKMNKSTEAGDTLQIKSDTPDALVVYGSASQGSIEEHQP